MTIPTPAELAALNPADPVQVAEAIAAGEAQNALIVAQESYRASLDITRQELKDALDLAALSPYPTPQEQAIIDAQVSESLASYRAIVDPPSDITTLATMVLTLRTI